ncbi:MAG: HutD family protein [Bdellovibrionota bacterium]|nr:MAG: HutD family protein [Bdellovibrionota bacterium]
MLVHGFQSVLRVTRAAELETKPWSGGSTTELLRLPTDSSLEARNFACRLSMAQVTQDGPFSRFEGYSRILVLLSGAGIHLNIDGTSHALTERFQSVEIRGSAAVSAKLLDGPVTDFNVIFRADVDATVQTVPLGQVYRTVQPQPPARRDNSAYWRESILWSPDGAFEVEYGRERVQVNPRDVFRVQHDQRPISMEVRAPNKPCTALLVSLVLPIGVGRY